MEEPDAGDGDLAMCLAGGMGSGRAGRRKGRRRPQGGPLPKIVLAAPKDAGPGRLPGAGVENGVHGRRHPGRGRGRPDLQHVLTALPEGGSLCQRRLREDRERPEAQGPGQDDRDRRRQLALRGRLLPLHLQGALPALPRRGLQDPQGARRGADALLHRDPARQGRGCDGLLLEARRRQGRGRDTEEGAGRFGTGRDVSVCTAAPQSAWSGVFGQRLPGSC
ncbi:MAG: hypothetical protein MZV70_52575 [Desulfobacterales bacterium]|nr:hypothetical protein [Desulfobacterales bacterium]